MTTAVPMTISADDLLTMPDGDRFELINGELIERIKGALPVWIAGQVAGFLMDFSDEDGGLTFGGGASYRCFNDTERVRKSDASYIRPGRLAVIPEGFLEIPPDLAVEVVSPTDRYREVEQKAEEYLEAGVVVVWVFNPSNRSVRIFRSDTMPVQLGPNDELTAEDIMPGFRCRVSDLFPKVPIVKRTQSQRADGSGPTR
ncbi:MAG: Uma2 family endonuclease [Planctomycetaceae bacterium]